MTVPGPAAGKGDWRDWAKARLASLDLAEASDGIVRALVGWERIGPQTAVLFYDPLPNEPDVTPLASRVAAWLTRVPGKGRITVHPYDSPRETHRYGFTQPTAGAPTADPAVIDVVLVPGLAFDRAGVRLGRGGGHYDRFLGTLRGDALIVGVIPSALLVDRLPREPHDLPMTHLVTEKGVMPVEAVDAAPELTAAARAWIAGDPDPATRAELQALARRRRRRRPGRPHGGDAAPSAPPGIRGVVEAGSNRMNRAVVIRTTRGLADYLIGRREGRRAGGRGLRRAPPTAAPSPRTRWGCWPPPGSRCATSPRWPPPRWWPTPPGCWGPRRRWWSPPATTRRGTTATRSTTPTARRSSPRSTPASPRPSTGWGRPSRCPGWRAPWRAASGLARPIEPAVTARYLEEVLALRPASPGRPQPAASSTPRCTAWAAAGGAGAAPGGLRRSATWCPSRPSPTAGSPRWPSPTRRSRGRSTWPVALAATGRAPTWSWPTTPTPTAWPSACPAAGSGWRSPGTRWACCWPTSCWSTPGPGPPRWW